MYFYLMSLFLVLSWIFGILLPRSIFIRRAFVAAGVVCCYVRGRRPALLFVSSRTHGFVEKERESHVGMLSSLFWPPVGAGSVTTNVCVWPPVILRLFLHSQQQRGRGIKGRPQPFVLVLLLLLLLCRNFGEFVVLGGVLGCANRTTA